MQPDRLAKLSLVSGVGSLGVFVVASILLAIYPPAASHRSASFSAAGGILLLMSFVSAIMAPVAVITGIKALRRFGPDTPGGQSAAAWVGIATGGVYTAMMILPVILFLVFA